MKKKDIIQLVKETVKENTFYGNREQPSQLSTGTKVSVPTDEYPFSAKPKRTATGMMEFDQPKSFDPDTINLVREMLYAADVYHDELVDDADTDEISSFLDSRSGGTYIKFPHFNGPQGRGALFGKETTDQIERSKAAAKAAALKTYTQFKTYIEDYEITDVSPAGVYGNIYLFLMFNDLAKDYTAPKGGTQSSQFEEINEAHPLNKVIGGYPVKYEGDPNNYRAIISEPMDDRQKEAMIKRAKEAGYTAKPNMGGGITIFVKESIKEAPMFKTDVKQDMAPKEMAERLKSVFDKVNGAKDPVKTPEWHKNRFKNKYGISFPETLKGINKDQALAMNKYANDMKITEADTKTYAGVDSVTSMKKDPRYGTLSGDAKIDLEKKLKDGGAVELEEEEFTNDVGKDDYVDDEGRMAKSQMYKTGKYAMKLHDMLDDMEQLPAWVQAKLTKASDYLSAVYHYLDYEFVRRDSNLMEHVDKYNKRALLMEGAMKKFFEMFDQGKTDEEIVQDYAHKGTQVPEAFVTKARRQYEGMKKLKLELEMSEKEFRNSSEKMVNNAEEGMEPGMEEKTLASGLTNEEPNEGNAFGLAMQKAKEAGDDSFELDGKTFKVEK